MTVGRNGHLRLCVIAVGKKGTHLVVVLGMVMGYSIVNATIVAVGHQAKSCTAQQVHVSTDE